MTRWTNQWVERNDWGDDNDLETGLDSDGDFKQRPVEIVFKAARTICISQRHERPLFYTVEGRICIIKNTVQSGLR